MDALTSSVRRAVLPAIFAGLVVTFAVAAPAAALPPVDPDLPVLEVDPNGGSFTVAPTDLVFPDTLVGESSTIVVTVTNGYSTAKQPNFAGGAPNDPNNFGGSQACAGMLLQPGGTCTFEYEFHPVALGELSTTTTIQIDSQSFSLDFAGVGTDGTAPAPTPTPMTDTSTGTTGTTGVSSETGADAEGATPTSSATPTPSATADAAAPQADGLNTTGILIIAVATGAILGLAGLLGGILMHKRRSAEQSGLD